MEIIEIKYLSSTHQIEVHLTTDCFKVPYHLYDQFELSVGMEISPVLYDQLKTENDQSQARQIAIHFLSYRLRTVHEVIERLKKEKYPQGLIDETIGYLHKNHHLDDERFVRIYVDERLRLYKDSKQKIRFALISKGVASSLISSPLEAATDEIELENAIYHLSKKLRGTQKSKDQLFRFLAGKGFSYATAKRAYNHCCDPNV